MIQLQLIRGILAIHHPTGKNRRQQSPQRQQDIRGEKVQETEEIHAKKVWLGADIKWEPIYTFVSQQIFTFD